MASPRSIAGYRASQLCMRDIRRFQIRWQGAVAEVHQLVLGSSQRDPNSKPSGGARYSSDVRLSVFTAAPSDIFRRAGVIQQIVSRECLRFMHIHGFTIIAEAAYFPKKIEVSAEFELRVVASSQKQKIWSRSSMPQGDVRKMRHIELPQPSSNQMERVSTLAPTDRICSVPGASVRLTAA